MFLIEAIKPQLGLLAATNTLFKGNEKKVFEIQ